MNSVRSTTRPSLMGQAIDPPSRRTRPGIEDRAIAIERLRESQDLLPANARVAYWVLESPQHLGPNKGVAAGDDGGSWSAAAAAATGRGRRRHVVVQVGVQRRQRKEIVIAATAERGDVGPAQGLADIDVLARVLGSR